MTLPHSTRVPRVIWTLWLQGWASAPQVARAALASWRSRNPGWQVHALDGKTLARFVPEADRARLFRSPMPPEASSDLIRFELLHRYGGVWADATTVCAQPLDAWLPDVMGSGFFAFDRPGPDRMIATWFLAAEKGSLIIGEWRAAAAHYWKDRLERDDYFWPHNLFADVYRAEPAVRALWDGVPKISAQHPFHFGPNSPALLAPPTREFLDALRTTSVPVFKLTHKFDRPYGKDSSMEVLCDFARHGEEQTAPAPQSRHILVAWYGSFPGHGTIGDLRSLESVVTHLVARGHVVSHATAGQTSIPGAVRVDWRDVDADAFDAVLFVCGPIIRGHPQTTELFGHFAGRKLAGVGVSLFPEGHANRFDPFDMVLARQGGGEAFGDVAVVAPLPDPMPKAMSSRGAVGLVLRGVQAEYGLDRCAWQETETLANRLAQAALQARPGRVVTIENHLQRSGKGPDDIERQYAECDLIVTSRFHGAITALRHGVPFVAIDQIRGGAKVHDLLADLGWPHVYEIDKLDEAELLDAVRRLAQSDRRENLMGARNKAVAAANHTLAELDRWVGSLA